MSQPRLPHTEGQIPVRFAPIQETQGMTRLKAEDKHPVLIQSERVLRDLYNTVSRYDHDYPGMLTDGAKQAVLALYGVLTRHSLVEQSVCLEIAADELRKCRAEVRLHARIVHALAEVERFLLLSAIAESARQS